MSKRIALVVPCFNEERRFPISYWREIICLENEIVWIFVDDGSVDATFGIIQEMVLGTTAQVRRTSKNGGKANAIRLGLLDALKETPDVEVLGYLDSDGAFSKVDILRMVKIALDEFFPNSESRMDAVISSRVALSGRAIHRKRSRHYLGRVVATFLTWDWENAPYDTQSGFKLFRNSEFFRAALATSFRSRWFVDIELLTRIGIENKGHLNIWEEPLNYWSDVEGSKISWRDSISIFREFQAARRQVSIFVRLSQ